MEIGLLGTGLLYIVSITLALALFGLAITVAEAVVAFFS